MSGSQNTKWFTTDRRTILVCFVLAAAVIVAYEPIRHNEFISYDDDLYITDNPQVQEGLNSGSIAWAFSTFRTGNWHPLTWVSHIIDYSIFGANPVGHHFVNAGFHIANVILLFLMLKKMTGSLWTSAFAAAVFGLHPLAVESAAWAAERKNVLSTFFAFLTIAAYLHYIPKRGLWRYILIVILFAMGLLSKPMLVTLPFVLVLLDYWPLNRFGSKFTILNSFYEKLPLMLMSAASCAVTYIAQAKGGAVAEISAVPMNLRVGNAIVSYVGYLGKIFYPVSLGMLYPRKVEGFVLWKVGVCLLVLVAISFAAVKLRKRYGWLFTGWFWYLGTLVPVIGFIQVGIQGMADRYVYLPGIGIYIVAAWLARETALKLKWPKGILQAAGAAILVLLLIMTRVQVRYWKDSFTLYKHTLAVTENNYLIQTKYGNLLRMEGRMDEAMEHLRRAVKIKPNYSLSHSNLALAYRDKGMFAEAAEEFEAALKYKPVYAMTHNYYGIMLSKNEMYDKAAEQFKKALEALEGRAALGSQRHFSGILDNFCNAGIRAGKLDEVLNVIEDYIAKKPGEAGLYYWAGIVYGQKGDKARAVERLEKGLTLAKSQSNEAFAAKIRALLAKFQQTEKVK